MGHVRDPHLGRRLPRGHVIDGAERHVVVSHPLVLTNPANTNEEAVMPRRRDPAADLVRALRRYQTDRGLTDKQLADRIGVSRTLWVQVRQAQVPVTERFATRAATITEIRPFALAILAPEPAPPANK